ATQLRRINRIRFRGREVPFTEGNIIGAIEKLKEPRASGLLKTNEDLTDLLLLGTSLDQTIDGETRGFQLRFIDWERPENNIFHLCAEFEVERSRSHETRRPDLVLFVNGIPLSVIECKAPSEDWAQAVSQHLRNQQDDEIPGLFRTVQFLRHRSTCKPYLASELCYSPRVLRESTKPSSWPACRATRKSGRFARL
ncbi:MAG: hypothetical protein LGL72_12650, partial [Acidibrevibacterium sp.]|uniref:type I restriction endonuclease n=1 Tax=Acidibrevibacterium fodinaquatile TaxID=1969806 RepID=UPI0023A8DF38